MERSTLVVKKVFLGLLFLSFTFSQVLRLETVYGFGIMVLDLFVIGGSVMWYGVLCFQKKITLDFLSKLFFGFMGVGLLGLLINPLHISDIQRGISVLYLVRYLAFGLLFFSLRTEKKLTPFLKSGLFVSGGVILMLGYLQYFFYNNLRNVYYLGWDEHVHRLFTTFLDPNFAGIFFTLYLLYLFYALFHNWFTTKWVYALIPLTTLALILTYSRSSYICAAIGVITLFWFEKKKKALLAFFSGVGILLLLLLPTFFTHNTDLFRIASSVSRVDSVKMGLDIASRHLITGVGFNAYRYAVQTYGYHKNSDIQYNHAEAGNNTSFLFVLGTTGVLGLGLYCLFLYEFVKTYGNNKQKGIVFGSMLVLVIGSVFNNVLFYTPLLFFFYLTIVSINSEK